jgi:hypothetical protein
MDWRNFPDSRRAELDRQISALDVTEAVAYHETWLELLPCIEKNSIHGDHPTPVAAPAAWAKDTLLRLMMTRGRNLFRTVQDLDVRSLVQRAHHLLEIYSGATIDPLVVRLVAPPKQTLSPSAMVDLRAAVEVEQRFISFLRALAHGEDRQPETVETLTGCIVLALILDCGVLGRRELSAALQVLWKERPVRAAGGSYYLWISLNEAAPEGTEERRRLFLTPLTAALAMAFAPPTGSAPPKVGLALRSICKHIGIPSDSRPRVTSLMRGAAARLRLAQNIPQFVVDYAEGRISSHAVSESAFRRLVGLSPWSSAYSDEPAKTQSSGGGRQKDSEEGRSSARGGGLCTAMARLLDAGGSSEELRDRIDKLRHSHPPKTPVEQLLCEWIVDLLIAPSAKGTPL